MIIAWIKRIIEKFKKKETVQALNEGQNENVVNNTDERKQSFIESLKVSVENENKESNVTVLPCSGNGNGIYNKVEC